MGKYRSFIDTMIMCSILAFYVSTLIGFFVHYETCLTGLFGKHAFCWLKWIHFLPGVGQDDRTF